MFYHTLRWEDRSPLEVELSDRSTGLKRPVEVIALAACVLLSVTAFAEDFGLASGPPTDNRLDIREFRQNPLKHTNGDQKRADAILELARITLPIMQIRKVDVGGKEIVISGMVKLADESGKVVAESQGYAGSSMVFRNACYIATSRHVVNAKRKTGEFSGEIELEQADGRVSPVGNRVTVRAPIRNGQFEMIEGTVVKVRGDYNGRTIPVSFDAALIRLDRSSGIKKPMGIGGANFAEIARSRLVTSSYAKEKQSNFLPDVLVIDPYCDLNVEASGDGQIMTQCAGSSGSSGGPTAGLFFNPKANEGQYRILGLNSAVDSRVPTSAANGETILKGNIRLTDVRTFSGEFLEFIKSDMEKRKLAGDSSCDE